MNISKLDALYSLGFNFPVTEFLDGTLELATLDEGVNEGVLPSDAIVDAEVTRLQAEYDNAKYARDRATAYPPMADQLDDIFHNGVAGWKKTIQAVKDTYPKP
jgi:hypothetical protein